MSNKEQSTYVTRKMGLFTCLLLAILNILLAHPHLFLSLSPPLLLCHLSLSFYHPPLSGTPLTFCHPTLFLTLFLLESSTLGRQGTAPLAHTA